MPDGSQRTTRQPEWDAIDRHIVTAWQQLQHHLCDLCGRPVEIHEHDQLGDYESGYVECTATRFLDMAQARKHTEDEPQRKKGFNPDRARRWLVWLRSEGRPRI